MAARSTNNAVVEAKEDISQVAGDIKKKKLK
jgi:hypothetical protein